MQINFIWYNQIMFYFPESRPSLPSKACIFCHDFKILFYDFRTKFGLTFIAWHGSSKSKNVASITFCTIVGGRSYDRISEITGWKKSSTLQFELFQVPVSSRALSFASIPNLWALLVTFHISCNRVQTYWDCKS